MRNPWPVETRHLRTLYRVFWLRVIDLEILASDADPSRLMGQVANILITVSVACGIPALLIGIQGLAQVQSWNVEHFFLETSMTLAALIAILNWDAAFPDRRDLLVLGPLPVRPITLLTAKVGAVFAAPLLAVGTLNVVIGLTWPLVFHAPGGFLIALRAWPAYWLTLLAGTVFCVFSILTLQGLAATLLPRQLFLRVSPLLQAATLTLVLTTYFLAPSFRSPAALTAGANQAMLHVLPAYWFLGFFQQINGSQHAALAPLATRAWAALGLSTLGVFTALLLSYFRTLPRIVEQPDLVPGRRRRYPISLGRGLAGTITRFSLRTLVRSRRHRMILSFYLGIGMAFVAGYLKTPYAAAHSAAGGLDASFLLASLMTLIFTVLALRVVVAIPIDLRANWVLRITQIRPAGAYRRAVRIGWLALAVVPVVLLLTAGLLTGASRGQVAAHLATMALLGAFLVEMCLASFRKIPFTCSYLPGKGKIHFAFWASLFLFIRVLKDAAEFESRMLVRVSTTALMMLALAALTLSLRTLTGVLLAGEDELVFEEVDAVEMVTLKLS